MATFAGQEIYGFLDASTGHAPFFPSGEGRLLSFGPELDEHRPHIHGL